MRFYGVVSGAVLAQLLITKHGKVPHHAFLYVGLCSLLSQLAPVQWQLVTISLSLVAAQQVQRY
jgi:hypothetical protein